MGFVKVEAVKIGDHGLDEGQVAISRNGTATFRKADAELVGMTEHVVALIDAESLCIALRPRRDGETGTFRLRDAGGTGDKARVCVGVGSAIKKLGLESNAVAGRFAFTTKGDMLIIALASGKPVDKPAKKKAATAAVVDGSESEADD